MATKKATIELEAFTNELGQTYSTIFDPKPAIDKEVRDFVREFESKRGARDQEALISMYDRNQLSAMHVGQCVDLAAQNFHVLQALIDGAVKMIRLQVDKESLRDEERKEELNLQRIRFEEERRDFLQQLHNEREDIRKEFHEREIKLRNSYQHKLRPIRVPNDI